MVVEQETPAGIPAASAFAGISASDACAGSVAVTSDALWADMLFGFMVVNAALAVFNVLPIPPLDGSKLVPLFLSPEGRVAFARFSQYGFLILFVLLFWLDGLLSFLGDWIVFLVRLAV